MSNTNDKWANKNLKVDDRVLIDWNVCKWSEGETNPECTEGTVIALWSGTYTGNGITVRWDNGKTNQYKKEDSDLVLVTSENKLDNKDSWFEKGEFPPAGTTCEANHNGNWIEVNIVGMDSEGYCVYENIHNFTHPYDGNKFPHMFRPSVKDNAIAELKMSFPNVPEETLKDIYSACKTMLEKQEQKLVET